MQRPALLNVEYADFSPHEAHLHTKLFGWIIPTVKTPELVILQIVGLDAAVVGF